MHASWSPHYHLHLNASTLHPTCTASSQALRKPPYLAGFCKLVLCVRVTLGSICTAVGAPCCPAINRVSARQVAVCPGGQARGYTYCIPSEDRLEAGLLTRSFMETRLTVAMAGRCALTVRHNFALISCTASSC